MSRVSSEGLFREGFDSNHHPLPAVIILRNNSQLDLRLRPLPVINSRIIYPALNRIRWDIKDSSGLDYPAVKWEDKVWVVCEFRIIIRKMSYTSLECRIQSYLRVCSSKNIFTKTSLTSFRCLSLCEWHRSRHNKSDMLLSSGIRSDEQHFTIVRRRCWKKIAVRGS